MERIKIAYLDWSYIFAGAERVLYTILDNIDKSRFEPYLVFPFPREYQSQYDSLDCHKVYLSPKATWWHGSDYWRHPLRGTDMLKRMVFGHRLLRFLKRNGITILHVNLLRPDCYWWLKACHDAGIKVIGHFRSEETDWIPGRRVQECCTLILCVSKFNRSRLLTKGKFVESRTLYDSVDTRSFVSGLTREQAKRKLGFPTDVRLMASVGQLSPHKGHDTAIRALAWLAGKYPDLQLLVAGGGGDLQRYKSLARETGVADRVVFTEKQVSNVWEVYRAADLTLSLTKEGEAFGLVPFESCYMGTPFIAPCFGAVTEFVENGETGMLVDTNCLDQVVETIDWALSHEAETREMVRRLREVIREKITPEVMIRNLEEVYVELYGRDCR